jgi:integrase
MPLTDTKIRAIRPRAKPYKVFDEKGLYLEIQPSGGRWWRLKYRFNGIEKRISLGVYPDVTLKLARERRDESRKLLVNGINPSEHRKKVKAAAKIANTNSFELVTREWFSKINPTWAESHSKRVIRCLERDIFPGLGNTPISLVTPVNILEQLRKIEARGALETAHRARWSIGQIFRYAVATGRTDRNPAADLKGALPPTIEKHYPAVTDPSRLAEILRILDDYHGTPVTRCALRLAPFVFVRPGELRTARWSDINFESSQWSFAAFKGKNPPVIVPLARQSLALLKELYPITGSGKLVFAGARNRSRAMSENTVNNALRKLNISKEEMSGHSFRATARTIMEEVMGFPYVLIEHQLAHKVKDPLGRAYNRTSHLQERTRMMQCWADYLDDLKTGVKKPRGVK